MLMIMISMIYYAHIGGYLNNHNNLRSPFR